MLYTWDQLKEIDASKLDLFDELVPPETGSWDVWPQQMWNPFTDFVRQQDRAFFEKTNLMYTTAWFFPHPSNSDHFGFPITICKEVNDLINKFYEHNGWVRPPFKGN